MKKNIKIILHNYKMIMKNHLNFLKSDKVKRLIFFNIYSNWLVILGLEMALREKDIIISHRFSLNLSHNHKNKKKKSQNKSKRRMSLRKLKSSQQLKRLKLHQQKRMKQQIQLVKQNHSNKNLPLNLVKQVNLLNKNQLRLNLVKLQSQQNQWKLIQKQQNQRQFHSQLQPQFQNLLKLRLMII